MKNVSNQLFNQMYARLNLKEIQRIVLDLFHLYINDRKNGGYVGAWKGKLTKLRSMAFEPDGMSTSAAHLYAVTSMIETLSNVT